MAGDDEPHPAGDASGDLAERLERVFGDDGRRTLEDIAAAEQVEVEAMVATRRALGLTAELGAPVYGAALEDHALRLRTATAHGIPLDALIALNRVIGRSVTSMVGVAAETLIEVIASLPATSEEERALEAAELIAELAPLLERVVGYALREHAREQARREAGVLLSADRRAGAVPVAVGFADLVGFTELGGRVTPEQLTEVAVRLERLATGVMPADVELVKTIGDAVMLVSPDPAALTATLLDLVAAADGEGSGFPRLRAGAAWGVAVRRAADWYGAAVNLASRVTALAEPGTLAGTVELVERVGTEITWSAAESREVRGVEAPVAVQVARPPAS